MDGMICPDTINVREPKKPQRHTWRCPASDVRLGQKRSFASLKAALLKVTASPAHAGCVEIPCPVTDIEGIRARFVTRRASLISETMRPVSNCHFPSGEFSRQSGTASRPINQIFRRRTVAVLVGRSICIFDQSQATLTTLTGLIMNNSSLGKLPFYH